MEKMARYRAQYASLDALLYRLQALNSSLTPTFTALNNPKN
jgi:flagellar capping protein FliD